MKMFPKATSFVLAALLLNYVYCITRQDIRLQYQPTLLRLRDLANTKYQEADREYNTLLAQVKKHQERSKNSTQTQINNIKNIIATAKKSPNVTTLTASCLKTQETAATRISTTSLNACHSNANFTTLSTVKSRFTTIANVAFNTGSWCTSLNPLDTQLESYGKCLADKVPDLNRQINIIEREYEELSNNTLYYNIKCLTDNAGAILGQISVISYDINVCFFTPL